MAFTSHLFLDLVGEVAELGVAGFMTGDRMRGYPISTGELEEVLAWVHLNYWCLGSISKLDMMNVSRISLLSTFFSSINLNIFVETVTDSRDFKDSNETLFKAKSRILQWSIRLQLCRRPVGFLLFLQLESSD